MSQADNRKRGRPDSDSEEGPPTPARPASREEIPQTPGSDAAMEVQVGNDDDM